MSTDFERIISNAANTREDRRRFLRDLVAAGAVLPWSGLALAQGSGGGAALPSYYGSGYQSIVEGSKKESGLVIYSNMASYNWEPIIKGFQKLYPWVKSVKTNNLDSSEVFERYYSESATGTSPADFMVTGDPTGWVKFAKTHHAALDYKSPELSHLPDFAEAMPGVYTFSADPILMSYNTALLHKDEQPHSIKQLVELVTKDSKRFKGKITTYDITVSFGFAIFYNWLNHNKANGWTELAKLLNNTRPERSSGPMVNKLNSGEDLAGYFLSSTVVFPEAKKSAGLLGWSYITDGTPIFLRGMGIPKTAPQMNTAKLMLDYIMSHDGQISVFNGGFTPYRTDLTKEEAPRSYGALVAEIGKENVIPIGYDVPTAEEEKEIIKKWKSYLPSAS